MLKSTVPTLEIKTFGTDLALVETIFVSAKTGDFTIVKSNDDIEVDNDVISVSLSQSEATQLNGEGGANVSIMAVKGDGSVSNVKIVWAKRGSRTDYGEYSGGGGGGSGGGETVSSFNGRTGDVVPERNDYTAEMVGAATMSQVNAAIQAAVLDSWGTSY